ncbi:MAG: hypothetical protein FIA99_08270 [Ruminiclostridium sp.]|nr:hypothetical protein [Ruminiclostridium sp.]
MLRYFFLSIIVVFFAIYTTGVLYADPNHPDCKNAAESLQVAKSEFSKTHQAALQVATQWEAKERAYDAYSKDHEKSFEDLVLAEMSLDQLKEIQARCDEYAANPDTPLAPLIDCRAVPIQISEAQRIVDEIKRDRSKQEDLLDKTKAEINDLEEKMQKAREEERAAKSKLDSAETYFKSLKCHRHV